jgi:hypothetical protein
MLRQAEQQPHRPHLEPGGFAVTRNLAGGRVDAPVAHPKLRLG